MSLSDSSMPVCKVCQSQFKYGGPEPFLLPCLHCVCQTCVESHPEGVMSCSICQETFLKTHRAKDAVTSKAVFLSTAKHNRSEILCTNRPDSGQATAWCSECDALLCHNCLESHSEIKSSRKHELRTLDELVQQGKDCQRKQQCQIHKEYPLELVDHDCDIMLCLLCRNNGHRGCDVGSKDQVLRYLKGSTIPEYVSKLTEKMGVNNLTDTALSEFEEEIERCRGNLKVSIRNTYQELHEMLQKREADVTNQLDQSLDALKTENQSSLSEVRLMTERCDTVLDFCQRSLKLSTAADIFTMKKTIEARATSCTRAKLPFIRTKDCLPMFTKTRLEDARALVSRYSCVVGLYPDTESETESEAATKTQDSRERQAETWRGELAKVERDLGELRLIVERHEKHANELRKGLNVGSFRRAVAAFMNTFRGRSQTVTS